ncbi:Eco57I restriction-modification methylase domain-containing protein [Nannocystaceae bacterium ST9]
MKVEASERTRRAVELVLRAAGPVLALDRLGLEAGLRAASRAVLIRIVRAVGEGRGLSGRRSIDASVRAVWSIELRECAELLESLLESWTDAALMAELDELLREPIEQVERSLDLLGQLHEHLLDHRLRASDEGWTLVAAGSTRKRSGTFYTPADLARATVDKTLGPALAGRSRAELLDLRICDPAMGGAVFLLAALDRLAEASGDDSPATRRALAERCLFGVDLDPHAVELARLALWLAVGDPELACDFAAEHLRHGNALIGLRDVDSRDAADRACARELAGDEDPSTLADRWTFFHWSIEFPEPLARGGFDAMLGNPPWEVRKPSSREFFGERDPDYRGRTKQAALDRQHALLDADPELRAAWTDERDQHRAFSRWIRHAFHQQGSADRNSYKLFVERAHDLLREGGRLGMIVPSGLHADKGAAELRALLLDHGQWEWLFGFENHAGIFAIHRSFKFAVIVARKGGTTQALRVAFMRRDVAQWQQPEPACLIYPRARIEQLSPRARAIVEVDDERDLALLERIHASGVRLGDEGWGVRYRREFDMTNDSHRFAPRPRWEAQGYRADEYGHWLRGDWRPIAAFGFSERHARDPRGHWSILARPPELVLARDGATAIERGAIEDLALPVYEGRMIDQYDFAAKGWVAGSGRSASWRAIGFDDKRVEPQFLIAAREHVERRGGDHRLALGLMDVGAATNSRTLIAALTEDRPHGNKVPRLSGADERDAIELLASLNSLTVDFALRQRLAGLTLNSFILAELPVAPRGSVPDSLIAELIGLALPHVAFARIWSSQADRSRSWRAGWASTPAERMRRRVRLDVVIASALGLDVAAIDWLLRDCDHPIDARPSSLAPKGFWRVDKQAPPRLRLTTLVRAAHRELCERGLAEFLTMNEGQGWLPPEELGPREHAWQRDEDVATSWAECERHAALIEGLIRLSP